MLNSEHSQFSWKPNLWPPAPRPADHPASPGSPALPVRGGPRASPPRPSPAASQAPRAPSQGVCLEKLPAGASEETGSPADRGGRPPPATGVQRGATCPWAPSAQGRGRSGSLRRALAVFSRPLLIIYFKTSRHCTRKSTQDLFAERSALLSGELTRPSPAPPQKRSCGLQRQAALCSTSKRSLRSEPPFA